VPVVTANLDEQEKNIRMESGISRNAQTLAVMQFELSPSLMLSTNYRVFCSISDVCFSSSKRIGDYLG
jgi:hypothetical protein